MKFQANQVSGAQQQQQSLRSVVVSVIPHISSHLVPRVEGFIDGGLGKHVIMYCLIGLDDEDSGVDLVAIALAGGNAACGERFVAEQFVNIVTNNHVAIEVHHSPG